MKIRRSKIFLLLIACLFILGACSFGFYNLFKPAPPVMVQVTPTTSLANPASVNCENKGGQVVIKQRGDGGQYGILYLLKITANVKNGLCCVVSASRVILK